MWSKKIPEESPMKLTKTILTALLLCLMLVMTACIQDLPKMDETISYTVTVVDTAGEPVVGALVTICQDLEGGICYMPVKTDENGMAVFHKEAVPVQDALKVRVMSGGGYDLPLADGTVGYVPIPNGSTTITLTIAIRPT